MHGTTWLLYSCYYNCRWSWSCTRRSNVRWSSVAIKSNTGDASVSLLDHSDHTHGVPFTNWCVSDAVSRSGANETMRREEQDGYRQPDQAGPGRAGPGGPHVSDSLAAWPNGRSNLPSASLHRRAWRHTLELIRGTIRSDVTSHYVTRHVILMWKCDYSL